MLESRDVELEATLSSVLDEIIPASDERGMPGAGALGLAAQLSESAPEIVPLLDVGLDALNERARSHGASGFPALAAGERLALLEAVSADQPAFLPTLLFHVYRAYYAHPAVLEALGVPARPPHPQGYAMDRDEPEDLGLLDAVRAREKLYREP